MQSVTHSHAFQSPTIARLPLWPYRIGHNHYLFPDPLVSFQAQPLALCSHCVTSSAMAHRCISRLSVSFSSPPSCPFEHICPHPSSPVCTPTHMPFRLSLRVIFVSTRSSPDPSCYLEHRPSPSATVASFRVKSLISLYLIRAQHRDLWSSHPFQCSDMFKDRFHSRSCPDQVE